VLIARPVQEASLEQAAWPGSFGLASLWTLADKVVLIELTALSEPASARVSVRFADALRRRARLPKLNPERQLQAGDTDES
jgi:hypothetical protein